MSYGPFKFCEYWRELIIAEMFADARPPITTTYSGVGVVSFDDPCGQLVVSPERIFRYVVFPIEATDEEQCNQGHIGVDLLCTLVRCVPVMDERGRPPTPAALSLAHASVLDDSQSIWEAVSAPIPVAKEWSRALVDQTFIGGDGGTIAVETRWTIGLNEAVWCET
tara:strand:+ start:202 stop:699 length:498 start_codon:yes stop_codon:yes gene_type:complete